VGFAQPRSSSDAAIDGSNCPLAATVMLWW
jgi:hypothetical protein